MKSVNGMDFTMQSSREEILLREKQALEQTLMNLTEEVESLSKRNEEFLRELKAKHDFYAPYKDQQDELRKLREAHALLISMIQSQQLSIVSGQTAAPTPKEAKSSSNVFGIFGRLADVAKEHTRSNADSEYRMHSDYRIMPLPSNRGKLDDPQFFRGRQSAATVTDGAHGYNQTQQFADHNPNNYESNVIRNNYNSVRRQRSSAGDVLKSFITCGTFNEEPHYYQSSNNNDPH